MSGLSLYDVIEFLNAIPEILFIQFFYHRIFDRKYNNHMPYILFYVFAYILLAVSSFLIGMPYVRICITYLILLSAAYFLYSGSMGIRFFATVYYLLIVFVSETLLAGILMLMGYGDPSELLQSSRGRILGMIGTKLFDFWLIIYSCRIYKHKVKNLPLQYWILILLMPVLSVIILSQIFSTGRFTDNKLMLGYILIVCGVLYLNFSVFNYFESFDKQIKLAALEQIMEHENENYRALADSYEEIRQLKHDLKNQIAVLEHLIQNEKYEEAKQHIQKLSSDIYQAASVCYTGNSAIDSILNLKGTYARNCNITFLHKINIGQITCDTVGICRILGNALDNAIETCNRTQLEQKCIYVAMNQIDKKLIIEIDNTSLPVDVSNLASSKPDKKIHGIGMQSIKQTVKNMNGDIIYYYENGYFSIQIMVYI